MEIKVTLRKFEGYSYFLPIPDDFRNKLVDKLGKRYVCHVNNDQYFHCALVLLKSVGYYITVGKSKKESFGLELGEEVLLRFEKDESKYQMAVSEEFDAVISTDPEAEILFEELTPGKQRGLIHYVNTAKSSQTRMDRALRIMNNLKLGIRDPRLLTK